LARSESLFASPSASILEYLERANLFLVPLDHERQWYRYHHLFADLLHVRLRQHEPKLEAVLNKGAANWYAQISYSFEAVRHALTSGDYSFAADLMEEYSLRLIWMNQIVTTLDWFRLLPPEVVESRPLLMIYQTFMLARRGEFERVETILANAEASIKTMPGSQKIDEYNILIFGMRAFMANLRGDSEKAIQFRTVSY
jgi:LuxR family maltose regulon positive regulatory protein